MRYFQLRWLWTVRHSLTPDILKTLLYAFVSCRLDYCNSLFAGVPTCDITRLQSVQNAAAHLFGGISKFKSVQLVLRDVVTTSQWTYHFQVGASDVQSPSWTDTILSDCYVCSCGKHSSPTSGSLCCWWWLGCASCKEHQPWRSQFFGSCTKAVEHSTMWAMQQLISENISYQYEDISI